VGDAVEVHVHLELVHQLGGHLKLLRAEALEVQGGLDLVVGDLRPALLGG
jgi:hypothetical protein